MTDKLDAERKALAEIPTVVNIGGRDFNIEPLSLYKLELVSDLMKDILPVIDGIKQFDDEKLGAIIRGGTQSVAKAFVILTMSNGTWDSPEAEPDYSDSNLTKIKRNLNTGNIARIIEIVRTSVQYEELLKNVYAQVMQIWKSSPGENSTLKSSNSPVGDSATSIKESQLEV
jgi:hypothetical protein